jgi:hypothetical protein
MYLRVGLVLKRLREEEKKERKLVNNMKYIIPVYEQHTTKHTENC